MSVNEVPFKQHKVPTLTKIQGADDTACTYCIGNEDHTLGNAVRHVLMQDTRVEFAGYSVPHPAEPVVQVRLQTAKTGAHNSSTSASKVLMDGLKTLHEQCGVVLEHLERNLPNVAEDRIRMEALLLEEGYDEDDEEEQPETME